MDPITVILWIILLAAFGAALGWACREHYLVRAIFLVIVVLFLLQLICEPHLAEAEMMAIVHTISDVAQAIRQALAL